MVKPKKISLGMRLHLLALPRQVTQKYTRPVFNPNNIDSGVRPSAIKGDLKRTNLRLNWLAQPNPRTKREKYVAFRDDIRNVLAMENQPDIKNEDTPVPKENTFKMDGDRKRPFNLRTLLLAIPKKTRRTKKYKPPPYIPGKVQSGVRPAAISGPLEDNWRINMLSQPNSLKKTDKYVFVPDVGGTASGISPSTLAVQCSPRSNDLAKPTLRYLMQNKKAFAYLGNRFVNNIDKTIQQTWDSLYNYYRKALLEIQRKRKARRLAAKRSRGLARDKNGKLIGKPKSEKEIKAEIEQRIAARCLKLSVPKRVFLPRKRKPKKLADLKAMAPKIARMSEPRFVTKKYLRPSIDSTYVDPLRVPTAAKAYVPSGRVLELARCPAHRLHKEPEKKPGAVKRSALTCKVSPRFGELAVPKKKAAEVDNDLKENPFEISKNAMKYVASARIQELAKPVERD